MIGSRSFVNEWFEGAGGFRSTEEDGGAEDEGKGCGRLVFDEGFTEKGDLGDLTR